MDFRRPPRYGSGMNSKAILPDQADVIASALRTISIEKQGLSALEAALGNGLAEPLRETIALIAGISGRVIVTGVGKSGHIGAKIAATFASTGTPAFFVHAAEANHGDLGMIAGNDLVLAISKGGESAELKSIIAYTRRFSIPLVSITCAPQASLARQSDVVLLVPADSMIPADELEQVEAGDAVALREELHP